MKNNSQNKPYWGNLVSVAVVAPKSKIITPEQIYITFRQKRLFTISILLVFGIIFLIPALSCIGSDKIFQSAFPTAPIISLIAGTPIIGLAISSVVKLFKSKVRIINGDFTVRTTTIVDTCSKYDSSSDVGGYDYYIKIENLSDSEEYSWVKCPESLSVKGKLCHVLYLNESGKEKPFLIYVGDCGFDKSNT